MFGYEKKPGYDLVTIGLCGNLGLGGKVDLTSSSSFAFLNHIKFNIISVMQIINVICTDVDI